MLADNDGGGVGGENRRTSFTHPSFHAIRWMVHIMPALPELAIGSPTQYGM